MDHQTLNKVSIQTITDRLAGKATKEISWKSCSSSKIFNLPTLSFSFTISHEIAVFTELKTYFSMGGEVFTSNPVTYSPLADETFEDPRNISAKLHHRVGRFVKIHLRFSSNWILISDVDFDISPVLLLG